MSPAPRRSRASRSRRELNATVDLAARRSFYRQHFMLDPDAWRGYSYPRSLKWVTIRFRLSEQSRLPNEAGVYAFLIQPGVAPDLDASYLVYVGETKSLRRRFGNYLRESAGRGNVRIQLYSMFKKFKDYVYFTYAVLPESERQQVEIALIAALTPPINRRLPVSIAEAERAF